MDQETKLPEQIGASNQTSKQPCAEAENIGKDITHALHRSKSYPKSIAVSVEGSEVSLTGNVPSLQDKKTAEAIAATEPGASHVKNDINIR